MYPTVEQLTAPEIGQINQHERHVADTETWLAEVLNGSMRTSFEYNSDGQELYGQDGGALGEIFDDSIHAARLIVNENPSLFFELRRRLIEKDEYEDMVAMANGEAENTMVVLSDFPPELMGSSQDVGGYNTDRQQTMMRIITVKPDGGIRMVTQSLDGSNRQALEAIYSRLGVVPEEGELLGQRIKLDLPEEAQESLTDELMDTYDDSLQDQYGGEWHAGRSQAKADQFDTYQFACAQHDLIDWFVDEKMKDPLAAEKLRFKLAAAVTGRYERHQARPAETEFFVPIERPLTRQSLYIEINRAAEQAIADNRTFSGCGASVSGGAGGTKEQLDQSGYGNKAGEDEYGPLNFECTAGHSNTREYGKLKTKCRVKDCTGTVGC